ncbi:MAG: penicillin-binding transpeptidase domain-containing protein [Tessaracoccus sp.]
MSYETGEILALVSTPTYDPEQLASLGQRAGARSWSTLLNHPDEPLKNRATREIYPRDRRSEEAGGGGRGHQDGALPSFELGGTHVVPVAELVAVYRQLHQLRQYHRLAGTGAEDVVQHGVRQPGDSNWAKTKIREMAEAFGFNQEQTIDIAAATSSYPLEMDEAQTALTAIGQFDVTSSPLQMAQVAAAIANDGVAMKPYLVSTVTNRDFTVVSSRQPERMSQPLSSTNAQLLQQMMEAVVADGTGTPAQVSGVTVGGKTGTAQTAPDRPPYAWFIGYAKEPKVAIAAFVENADVERDDISGGRLAAPIFKAVVEALQ